jgi:hypothetical protein
MDLSPSTLCRCHLGLQLEDYSTATPLTSGLGGCRRLERRIVDLFDDVSERLQGWPETDTGRPRGSKNAL